MFLRKGIFLRFMNDASQLQHWQRTPVLEMAMFIQSLYGKALNLLKFGYFTSYVQIHKDEK